MVAKCSTPVGVKDRFTWYLAGALRWENVLNACRSQRSVHDQQHHVSADLGLCSTPVGVKDRFTRVGSGGRGGRGGALRLSASKIGSLQVAEHGLVQRACSTPVGVKDRFTCRFVAIARGRAIVLNACRSQRSVHKGCAG